MPFERDDDGKINIMKSHQGGFAFEPPRKGHTLPTEIDLKQAARCVGIIPWCPVWTSKCAFRTTDWRCIQDRP